MSDRLCDFVGDGKPGACLRPAQIIAKRKRGTAFDLCNFHAGFVYSTDYFNKFEKPRKLSPNEPHQPSEEGRA